MTKKKRTKGRLLAILLAVTAVFAVGAIAPPVHAAGSYQINGEYKLMTDVTDPEITDIPTGLLEGTTMTLYKVGGFGRAADDPSQSILVLDPAFASLSVDLNDADHHKDPSTMSDAEKVAWTKTWLESAQSIYNVIKTNPDSFTATDTDTLDADGKFTLSADNGLYLLVGESKELTDYPQPGNITYWSPQPMLVQVLNGSQDIGVKPVAETVSRYTVSKRWSGDEAVADRVRPKQVTIVISYDGKVVEEVTLPDENGTWSYTWTATKEQKDPTKWAVTEKLSDTDLLNYKWKVTESVPAEGGIQKDYVVTNTYSRQLLELKKNTETYLQSDEELASAAIFDITGFDANKKQVFHVQRGVQISGPGASDPVYVDVPANVTSIKVKEIYKAANYEPVEAEQEADYTPPVYEENGDLKTPGLFEVTFDNKYKGSTSFNSGIVNKFRMNGDDYQYDDGRIQDVK